MEEELTKKLEVARRLIVFEGQEGYDDPLCPHPKAMPDGWDNQTKFILGTLGLVFGYPITRDPFGAILITGVAWFAGGLIEGFRWSKYETKRLRAIFQDSNPDSDIS